MEFSSSNSCKSSSIKIFSESIDISSSFESSESSLLNEYFWRFNVVSGIPGISKTFCSPSEILSLERHSCSLSSSETFSSWKCNDSINSKDICYELHMLYSNDKLQAVLCLHGSLTTRFILVVSYVHLVLNHSSAYPVFCLHSCFSKFSKTA